MRCRGDGAQLTHSRATFNLVKTERNRLIKTQLSHSTEYRSRDTNLPMSAAAIRRLGSDQSNRTKNSVTMLHNLS